MNNLKFRAYFKQYERMIENIGIVNQNMILVDFLNDGNLEPIFIIENEIFVMQSTGLFDKNGKEIFEEDIVIDTVGPQIKMVVKWIDDCAAFRTIGTYEGENFVGYVGHETKFGKNTCQVIGNIYENKELLR
ncbi:YopX family protein [Parvimonas micra]